MNQNAVSRVMTALLMIGCVTIGFVSSKYAINAGQTAEASMQDRTAFLSGGARSERVLQDILVEMKEMNQRLERIESVAREYAEAAHQQQNAVSRTPRQPSVR